MSLAKQILEGPLPRPYRYVGLPLAAFVLVAVFVFAGFPYDRLGDRIAAGLSRASGADVRLIDVRPRITIGGPGIKVGIASVAPPHSPPSASNRCACVRPGRSAG